MAPVIDIEALLEPISKDHPAGRSCIESPEYGQISVAVEYVILREQIKEMRRRARMTATLDEKDPIRRFADESLKAAEASLRQKADVLGAGSKHADQDAQASCIHLLTNVGKDLDVARCLALLAVWREGVEGLALGFRLFEGLLDKMHDQVHPLEDTVGRTEAVRAAVLNEMLDGRVIVSILRESVLVGSSAGRIIFRDLEVLGNTIGPEPGRSASEIELILTDVMRLDAAQSAGINPEILGIDLLIEHIELIRARFENLGTSIDTFISRFPGRKVDGKELVQAIRRAGTTLSEQANRIRAEHARNAVATALLSGGILNPQDSIMNNLPSTNKVQAGSLANMGPSILDVGSGAPERFVAPDISLFEESASHRLSCREDAIVAINGIAQFLERTQPGHPAPMFLHRAVRLLNAKTYFDIVQDLTPSVVDEVAKITGQKRPAADTD